MRADSARSTLAGKVSERASPALMADQYFRHTWNVFVPPFDSSLSDQLREAARHPSSGTTTVSDDAVIVGALLTIGGAHDVACQPWRVVDISARTQAIGGQRVRVEPEYAANIKPLFLRKRPAASTSSSPVRWSASDDGRSNPGKASARVAQTSCRSPVETNAGFAPADASVDPRERHSHNRATRRTPFRSRVRG
jgi:hypothetical protein